MPKKNRFRSIVYETYLGKLAERCPIISFLSLFYVGATDNTSSNYSRFFVCLFVCKEAWITYSCSKRRPLHGRFTVEQIHPWTRWNLALECTVDLLFHSKIAIWVASQHGNRPHCPVLPQRSGKWILNQFFPFHFDGQVYWLRRKKYDILPGCLECIKRKYFRFFERHKKGADSVSVQKAFAEYNVVWLGLCRILCHSNWLL